MVMRGGFFMCCLSGDIKGMREYLKSGKVDINEDNSLCLRYACFYGLLDVVKCLVDHKVDIHARNDDSLRSAAANGHLEIVKCLVEQGADIHAADDYALRNNLALHVAAKYGHLEIVKYLCSVYLERYGIAWCLTSD